VLALMLCHIVLRKLLPANALLIYICVVSCWFLVAWCSIDLTPSISHWQPKEIFTRLDLPLHIDIGCAKGRCIERMSKRTERQNWNHLGVEIRARTVEEANQRVANERKLQYIGKNGKETKNLHFLTCNFAASVKELLDKFPRESLQLISIQFPDPWKRKKHQRRLIVQKKLVKQLAASLPPGAVVYISSDCDNVATWMTDRFLECDEENTNPPDISATTTSGGNSTELPKKKCFRLLSTLADLDSITTPNMFLTQSSVVDQCSEGVSSPVATTAVESEEVLSPECHNVDDCGEKENKEEGTTAVLELEDSTAPTADSYSWFAANNNPLGELSERELVCEVDWRGVRRCCFMRL
jgi:tRNA (guanine-N7-)-methyltransferase